MNLKTAPNRIPDDAVALGKLGRAHGLNGEIRFFPYDCEADFLLEIGTVLVGPEGQEMQVKGLRGGGKFRIILLEGVESRTDAEQLQGSILWIPEDRLPPLPPTEMYVASVIGAEVRDEQGIRVGVVVDVMETSESDVLVIQGENGSEEMIPALRSALTGWDAETRVLTVRWPMDGQE
ncbi:MAG TPA: ribosome maturation factor RimM [bacterium]|nr:ribosome maturation factor RimM [bacterium]HQL63217.1 ribosome maturation factor RimM [bacterium]